MNGNQRRKETRIGLNLLLPVKRLYVRNEQVLKLNKILPVTVQDISAGGVLLYCPLEIPEYVQFHLDLPVNGEIISCLAQITRKDRYGEGFHYGCKLITFNDKEKNKIRKYVYRKILEKRRNKDGSGNIKGA